MGNICGKESADPFAQPGRTLASTPAGNANTNTNNPKSSVPRKVGGPARTLGSSNNSNSPQTDSQKEDARRKAAEAAEARAKGASAKPKGKLGSQLDEQKKQTRTGTLAAASEEERLRRDADQAAEQRAYN